LHLVGILFPHINNDARSKSHQKWSKTYIGIHVKYRLFLSDFNET